VACHACDKMSINIGDLTWLDIYDHNLSFMLDTLFDQPGGPWRQRSNGSMLKLRQQLGPAPTAPASLTASRSAAPDAAAADGPDRS
jgi:hypothetical protein